MTGRNVAAQIEEPEDVNCVSCPRPDSEEDMVQCDSCDQWQHYTCAGVDEAIASVPWLCGKCSAKRNDDAVSVRSQASSTFSVSLSQMVERQKIERERADLEIQRGHLEEQQRLLANAVAQFDSVSGPTAAGPINSAYSISPQRSAETSVPVATGNAPPLLQLPIPAGGVENLISPTLQEAPRLVPIPLTLLSSVIPPTSTATTSRGTDQHHRALIALKRCVEQCEAEKDLTQEQLEALQIQLENCRRLFERKKAVTETIPPKPRKPTGTIPKVSYIPTVVPQTRDAGPPVARNDDAFFVPHQRHKQLVGQTDPPRVSDQSQELLSGKRHATKNNNHIRTDATYPTMNASKNDNTSTINLNRQQQRNYARSTENSNLREQVQEFYARPEESNDKSLNQQCDQISYNNHSRNFTTPTNEFPSHPLSQPSNALQNQVSPSSVFSHPTQQQLVARQSLAKDLPSFSGDPMEWPIFISHYEYTTEACGFSDGENMLRLQRCLVGSALEAVRSQLIFPAAVPDVIDILKRRYGRPALLINGLLRKVREIPAPKSERLETLINFGMAVQALCNHIKAANEHTHLANPSLLRELVSKLPTNHQMMWASYKRGFHAREVDLKMFNDYMTTVVEDASSIECLEPSPTMRSSGREHVKGRGFINTHTAEYADSESSTTHRTSVKEYTCSHCDQSGHKIAECNAFRELSVDDRWRRIREKALCQNCLYNHGRRSCRIRRTCDIDNCQYRHHRLLHSSKISSSDTVVAEHHTHREPSGSALFRIIPVILYGSSGFIETFAFLDEGSDLTLIECELAKELGVKGSHQPLCLKWTGNTSRLEKNSQRFSIQISGIDQKKQYTLNNARTVDCLGLPSQSFNLDEATKKYVHLKGAPIPSYTEAKPRVLIGIDNLKLALPLKVKEGDGTGLVATKTRLGWCVYGPRKNNIEESHNFQMCECSCDEDLQESVKNFFNLELTGSIPTNGKELSEDEKRALTLLEVTTKRVGKQFETGLLFRKEYVEFPNSYPMAVSRLKCLERRMDRDPALKENLHRQIAEYENKGYAHKATKMELEASDPKRVWYLPVGAVTNPKKPGKVRIIWDAAAKVDGISLNSELLKGPDQLVSLPGVLFRFRQYTVAVTSDIKEMFHQILIRDQDKQSQRFLWRENPSEAPTIYVMDVATFGSTCSPASAQFTKNRNAEQHQELYPEASKAIIHDTYVDDYLASFGTEKEAAKVVCDIRKVNENGGFKLHNWRSNSVSVLKKLGEEPTESLKSLKLVEGNKTERVLGMLWDPSNDVLSFSTQMSDEVEMLMQTSTRPTKRQVLRCVMTLFDPLGLLSPFIIHGKVLIQDLWREGTEWDEQISDQANVKWQRWIKMVEFVSVVRISRCYFSQATQETYRNAQIHVFVDASEVAYSCAIYIRVQAGEDEPRCCLIAAKAKVAPVKPWSIPRMELQGCVLGVRWSKFVRENHSVPISRVYYWTDSRTALAWIKGDPRNYRQFISFRIGEILENTMVSDWRWVPTKINPADEATKWGSGPYFDQESKWFSGPDFLRRSEVQWPRPDEPVTTTTEEIRTSVLHHCSTEPVIDFTRFSTWNKLLRSTAYVMRFVCNTSKKSLKFHGHLQQEELLLAENVIIKLVQRETYPDQNAALQSKAPGENGQKAIIGKRSSIYKLLPIMDDEGLLREQGRIGAATNVPYERLHPIILPRNHYVTELIVSRYHRLYRHGNHETVVNELRQLYNIPRMRMVVKRICKDCPICKIRNARPKVPPMAPLPVARLAHHERAFTYTGLDYFGPLSVKQGRSNVKRWVALFTCLTIRAVHLEIAYTLTTASCISCVRRFVGRRGPPVEIFTDNGTNFQGADRVLRSQISQGLSATFTDTKTKWNFNPPGAPHMGGAWERLVKSVKCAMEGAYSEGKLDDEGLQTLIVEVENMVNTRPLTYLPLESEEAEALTPNHFLLLSSNGTKLPRRDTAHQGRCGDGNDRHMLGNAWELIQHQLDVFWQRWLTEYLPVIRRQSKWFEVSEPLKEGDLVMVAEPTKRGGWERGRIAAILPHSDGHLRRAVVQIGSAKVTRPVTRLASLDVRSSEDLTDGRLHLGEDVPANLATWPTK